MLALTLVLLLQIILFRFQLIARLARKRHFMKTWRPLLAAEITGEEVTLPRLSAGEREFFLALWNHLQESLRGTAKRRLNAVAERCGMRQYAHLLLHKRALRPRLMALATLGNLGDHSAWDDLRRLANSSDPLLSLAAVRALFQIDAPAALRELLRQLIDRNDWSVAQLAIVIKEAGPAISFSSLVDSALSLASSTTPLDQARLNRLLHLLEVAPPQDVLPLVRAIIPLSTDDEVTAQCLKLLSEPADLPILRRHLEHPIWFVRLQAARALSRMGSMEDVPRLVILLSDPVWWVRYRTAQALIALTHNDARTLSQLHESLSDRYAQEMLNMAMIEQGLR